MALTVNFAYDVSEGLIVDVGTERRWDEAEGLMQQEGVEVLDNQETPALRFSKNKDLTSQLKSCILILERNLWENTPVFFTKPRMENRP